MTASLDEEALGQLVQRIDPQWSLRHAWNLTGGVSAQVTALEVERADGQTHRLIVRRHGSVDLEHNPHIARDEFTLLEIARSHGLAVPKAYEFDESCELLPSPFIVIDYIEGDTEYSPADVAGYLLQMAAHLARIHSVKDSLELTFLPGQARGFGERPALLDQSMHEGRIRDALESAWPLAQTNEPVLLHGDFWPGNILWRAGEIVAIIDWEDAGTGDPLVDLGNSRLEILWAFGADAMREFTERYTSMTAIDVTNLPYWDLCAALRPCSRISSWGLDDGTEKQMRTQHQVFVTQALQVLSVQ